MTVIAITGANPKSICILLSNPLLSICGIEPYRYSILAVAPGFGLFFPSSFSMYEEHYIPNSAENSPSYQAVSFIYTPGLTLCQPE